MPTGAVASVGQCLHLPAWCWRAGRGSSLDSTLPMLAWPWAVLLWPVLLKPSFAGGQVQLLGEGGMSRAA